MAPEGLEVLKKKMRLAPDTQQTYGLMEGCYRHREPFTKNIDLLPDMLWAIARNYQKQGIQYAELSSNAVLDPVWLKEIHDVMPKIEAPESEGGTGVHLRFKAGFPRNLSEADLAKRIEQYKRVAISPYIAGVDVLGYEINKTYKMRTQLEALAEWMKENQPDDILQIHAGENAKNPENVKEALELTRHYNVMLHLGHSIHGIDDETLKRAKEQSVNGKLIVQFNLDSNLALNNIDFPSDAGIKRFLDADIACVLGSDGADLYRTSARQTAMAALYCGVTPEDFRKMRDTERAYIKKRQEVFQKKSSIFEKERAALDYHFFQALPKKSSSIQPKQKDIIWPQERQAKTLQALNTRLAGKRPVFFAGGGGGSWESAPSESKKEFSKGLSMLLEKLDPDKFYFVKGRTKESGVNLEVDKAVEEYNQSHEKKFYCVTLQSEAAGVAAHPTRSEFLPVIDIDVPLVSLPNATTNFLQDRRGFAFYAGGRNFTRDFILLSYQKGIPFGIMEMKDITAVRRFQFGIMVTFCNFLDKHIIAL